MREEPFLAHYHEIKQQCDLRTCTWTMETAVVPSLFLLYVERRYIRGAFISIICWCSKRQTYIPGVANHKIIRPAELRRHVVVFDCWKMHPTDERWNGFTLYRLHTGKKNIRNEKKTGKLSATRSALSRVFLYFWIYSYPPPKHEVPGRWGKTEVFRPHGLLYHSCSYCLQVPRTSCLNMCTSAVDSSLKQPDVVRVHASAGQHRKEADMGYSSVMTSAWPTHTRT